MANRPVLWFVLLSILGFPAGGFAQESVLAQKQEALRIAEQSGDPAKLGRALLDLGSTYGQQQRPAEGLPYLEKSLALSEEIPDRQLTAAVLNSLGYTYSLLEQYEVCMAVYEKSLALAEAIDDRPTMALVLSNISAQYILQSRYAEAFDALQKSFRIDEDIGRAGGIEGRKLDARRLLNMGILYRRQGHVDQALAYDQKSLKQLEEIGDAVGVADVQNEIGVVYKLQGRFDEALKWFQQSLSGYEKLRHDAGIARSLNNIGDIHRAQGRSDLAAEALERSLRLREEKRDRAGICVTLNSLARLHQSRGAFTRMLEVSRRSAEVAEEMNNPEEIWRAQELMGHALRALGRPAEAHRSFLAAIGTIESLRHEVAGGEQQRQSFLEQRLSPWLAMIDLLVSQERYGEALTFAERSKARVLLDALHSGRANVRKALSSEERQSEEEKRLRIASLNLQLGREMRREKPSASRVAELKADLERARLEYEDFETGLYVARPELKLQRGDVPVISVEDLGNLFPDDGTALLAYVMDEDRTYLFVVTRVPEPRIEAYTLPIRRQEIASRVEGFRKQLAGRDPGFRASAKALYRDLVRPAEVQLGGKSSYVIAPDDTLWGLPFQALVTSANHYLIEDVAVSYAPSLTVLDQMMKRRKDRDPEATTLLALGNPLLGSATVQRATLTAGGGKLAPLPEAEAEVKALRDLYGAARSRIYVGREAREDLLKKDAERATILHFATHGVVSDASPMYSYLALAEGKAGEDGLLEAWELMQLDLKADLAVLSACETARGRFGAGEGMIGLSWAMFIAGVPSLVVSQWKVDSAGTRDLMVNFHRALIAAPEAGKASALRQAALKLMKNRQTRHPSYWAGFLVVGDAR